MKLGTFIEALEQYDHELVVTLADWNEDYAQDNGEAAERIKVVDCEYTTGNGFKCNGIHICIG